jgi:putative transcriptional regulator
MKDASCATSRIWSSRSKTGHVPIIVNLDVMLARRKLQLNTVAERIGITPQNLSVLNAGRARAIRFSTLERLCEVLECQPGDLLAFESPEQLETSALVVRAKA